ncbi:saccharopine dehydrogenase NADP-binding domain-containing protein [Bacillus sonorensis]|uniref:saccharopine dehydrogenase NADP-binding domain-containing protein n=1 Tax=Bacillus sonorensis TaxID=119858 RepID=UPI0018CDF765|nr:saccharopine dehydrogenase NADP-binding domain-containing protein [Bacillus sonorensis]MCF7620044.1 saccharopine dehydrogenase NADP-binding domain-containing protein [Bacillus sonorensis]
MLKQHIVVIGGYGYVGGHICRMLGEKYPGLVYAAGRNLDRAQRLCRETGGKVKPMRFNRDAADDWAWFEQTKLVIVCIDQEDTDLAEACLANGTDYIDISANGPFLARIERLNAGACRGTGVLSVGLAPGLTNLLAQEAKKAFDETNRIDITIMLGLGDSHGKAAIEWTVDQLHSVFDITDRGRVKKVGSFTGGRPADLGCMGRRMAYRFPFSDQMTLPNTLGVPSIATRLCFDSRVATFVIAGLKKSGAARLLKHAVIRSAAVKSLGSLQIGSAKYAVKVDAAEVKDGRSREIGLSLHGERESLITAKVAAAAAHALYNGSFPQGVFHIEQLFELEREGESLF